MGPLAPSWAPTAAAITNFSFSLQTKVASLMALKMTMMLTEMTAPDRMIQKFFSALLNSPKSDTQISIIRSFGDGSVS